jgi:hypothetical protein
MCCFLFLARLFRSLPQTDFVHGASSDARYGFPYWDELASICFARTIVRCRPDPDTLVSILGSPCTKD